MESISKASSDFYRTPKNHCVGKISEYREWLLLLHVLGTPKSCAVVVAANICCADCIGWFDRKQRQAPSKGRKDIHSSIGVRPDILGSA